MLDPIQLDVRDLERSITFYKAVLAMLGYEPIYEVNGSAGLGVDGSSISAYRAENRRSKAFMSHSAAKIEPRFAPSMRQH